MLLWALDQPLVLDLQPALEPVLDQQQVPDQRLAPDLQQEQLELHQRQVLDQQQVPRRQQVLLYLHCPSLLLHRRPLHLLLTHRHRRKGQQWNKARICFRDCLQRQA